MGDQRDNVLRALPKPSSMAKRGDREIVSFANGSRIEFTHGKVTDIRGTLPAPIAAPAAAADLPAVATAPAQTERAPKPATPATKTPSRKTPAATRPTATASTADKPAATPAESRASKRDEALKAAGVKLQAGPATVPLGKVAQLKLPNGYSFVGPDSLDRFYQLTQNVRSGNEAGVVVGPDWMLFFDYDEIGYVKDEDKDKLNAEKLMKTMAENQEEANASRKKRGWDELKLKSWATPPHYDEKTHNLKWAINLSSSQDGFKDTWINESIRLLGRSGVMNVTIVGGTDVFKAAEQATDQLLAQNFSYVSGQKYSEFKAGDKVAAYGLSALVLGGAGVMAAKAGLFAKLGILLGKFWKMIVLVFAGIAAAFGKLLNKITRGRPEEPSA